ncbi:HNH endonuclease family protein [Glutamicibacter sp.]|uniref:HNH endonuclease family protein n=1 Tax=Glutamicibacter sp. TaxID=1931995 RepID=UPI003D6A8BA4
MEFPPLPDAQAAPTPSTAEQGDIYAESLELLNEVTVKGRAPKTGYERAEFGKGWKDPDRNGCDARNDILSRDLVDVTYKSAKRPCVVLSGKFDDPYTGKTIDFKRGQGTSTAVQIDHVVALSDSWQKGAQRWDADTRLEFANDPLNLLASDGPTNASKGDKDAASWLPPNKSFRCAYVSRQTQVKAKYDVWMTKAEHAAIGNILKSCI